MRKLWVLSSEVRAARRAMDCPYPSGQMELPQACSGPAVRFCGGLITSSIQSNSQREGDLS
jgi:hypothetical protein